MSVKPKPQEKNKMSEIDDQILKYFDIKKRLGKGAYGIVWKATDKKSSQIVAVKKIFDAFRNETDAQRTFREIMFLRAFRNHPNVIQLHSIYKAANNLDIYLSFEFMESDLHNVIKRGSILRDVHKRYVMYQLLNAIKYIHSGNVIHRDLKPSNILIDSKCRCKIADFGLARSVSHRQIGEPNISDPSDQILTDYVATRWYRAPEILVASKRYTKGIDMWSLGCILGEMIRGKPLFPGSSTINQVERIISSLPTASEREISAIGGGFGSVLLNQQINSNSNPKLDDLLSGSTEDSRNLVKSLLILDPVQRLTAKQALSHKYVEKFRHTFPESELSSDILPPFRDDVQLSVSEYRSKLYEIMMSSEKGSICIKQTKRKKDILPTTHLEGSILAISSSDKKIYNMRPNEKEKHSIIKNNSESQLYKKQNKKYVSVAQNNAREAVCNVTKMPKNYKSQSEGQQFIQTKARISPKLKYCKITSLPESSKCAVSSERGYQEAKQYLPNRPHALIKKRHSIDCTYSSGIDTEKSGKRLQYYNSFTNLMNVKNKTLTKPLIEGNNTTSYVTINNTKNSRYETPTDEISLKRLDHCEKIVTPAKITRAEFLNLASYNGSYYEKRLKNLEEKIEHHKMDIKALFAKNSKKQGPLKSSDTLISDKKNATFEMKNNKNNNNKSYGTLNRSKSENDKSSSAVKQARNDKFSRTFSQGGWIGVNQKFNGCGVLNTEDSYEYIKSQLI